MEKEKAHEVGLVVSITTIGAVLRIVYYLNFLESVPSGDDFLYYTLARQLAQGQTYTHWREPGFPFFLSLLFRVIEPSFEIHRLITTILGICLIPIFYLFCRKNTKSIFTSVIASLILAFYSDFITNAARGLREEYIAILFLGVIHFGLKDSQEMTRNHYIRNLFCLGILTALLATTNISSIITVIAATILGILFQDHNFHKKKPSLNNITFRRDIGKIIVIGAIFGLVFIIHSIHCLHYYGISDLASRIPAAQWHAMETSVPYPNDYAEMITLWDFYFGVRDLSTTINYFILGIYRQIIQLFVSSQQISSLSFVGFGLFIYGLIKSSKKTRAFTILFTALHLVSLSLFAYFWISYRFYMNLNLILFIIVATGFTKGYREVQKRGGFHFRIDFFDKLFKKLHDKTRGAIKTKLDIQIDQNIIFSFILVVLLIEIARFSQLLLDFVVFIFGGWLICAAIYVVLSSLLAARSSLNQDELANNEDDEQISNQKEKTVKASHTGGEERELRNLFNKFVDNLKLRHIILIGFISLIIACMVIFQWGLFLKFVFIGSGFMLSLLYASKNDIREPIDSYIMESCGKWQEPIKKTIFVRVLYPILFLIATFLLTRERNAIPISFHLLCALMATLLLVEIFFEVEDTRVLFLEILSLGLLIPLSSAIISPNFLLLGGGDLYDHAFTVQYIIDNGSLDGIERYMYPYALPFYHHFAAWLCTIFQIHNVGLFLYFLYFLIASISVVLVYFIVREMLRSYPRVSNKIALLSMLLVSFFGFTTHFRMEPIPMSASITTALGSLFYFLKYYFQKKGNQPSKNLLLLSLTGVFGFISVLFHLYALVFFSLFYGSFLMSHILKKVNLKKIGDFLKCNKKTILFCLLLIPFFFYILAQVFKINNSSTRIDHNFLFFGYLGELGVLLCLSFLVSIDFLLFYSLKRTNGGDLGGFKKINLTLSIFVIVSLTGIYGLLTIDAFDIAEVDFIFFFLNPYRWLSYVYFLFSFKIAISIYLLFQSLFSMKSKHIGNKAKIGIICGLTFSLVLFQINGEPAATDYPLISRGSSDPHAKYDTVPNSTEKEAMRQVLNFWVENGTRCNYTLVKNIKYQNTNWARIAYTHNFPLSFQYISCDDYFDMRVLIRANYTSFDYCGTMIREFYIFSDAPVEDSKNYTQIVSTFSGFYLYFFSNTSV